MTAFRLTPFALSLLLLPGCYLRHGLEGDAGSPPPTPRDSAADTHVGRDASSDGGALPTEPDPDLGPDARPSDYPEADDWDDPPVIAEGDPCCVLGEPIRVVEEDEGINLGLREPARIAWGAGRWAVLTGRTIDEMGEIVPRAAVLLLEREGTRIGAAHVLDLEPSGYDDIRWAEGRWAVATMGGRSEDHSATVYGRLYDRDFRPAGDIVELGRALNEGTRGPALARLTHGDRWVALRDDFGRLGISPFHERGTDPATTAAGVALDTYTLCAVGMRSRIAVLTPHPPGSPVPNELLALGGGPEYRELGRIQLESRFAYHAVVTALRDLVVVAGVEDGRTTVEVLDPFALTSVGEAGVLTSTTSRPFRAAVDLAGSSKLGVAGACYVVDADGEFRVDFQLVGPDGRLHGQAVEIAQPYLANCTVGSDDLGFLVAWWDHAELWVRRVFVAD